MGAKAWESRPNVFLGVFSEARYVWDRGLGFSLEAAPSWDASVLFWENKAGSRPSWNMRETRVKERAGTGMIN